VDPVPDPLPLRKSGSAGNRTHDLWIGQANKPQSLREINKEGMVSQPGKQRDVIQRTVELVRGKRDTEGQTYWIVTETSRRTGLGCLRMVHKD
jgi:hypothetical protein